MNITETISFITSEVSDEDMAQIVLALKWRRQVLGQIEAAVNVDYNN